MSVSGVSDVRVFAYKDMLCAVYTGNCNNIKSVLRIKLNYREMPTIIKNVESIPLNKNGKTDYKKLYEIVLEKYIKKSSTQNLVDFYLVNTKTLEVTDQQRDYW